MIESPSIVPDLESLIDLVEQFADAEIEGDREALQAAESMFQRVPVLRKFVHTVAIGKKSAVSQGERSTGRRRKTERRAIEWARKYRRFRIDPTYRSMSDSDLKAWVGQRPPLDFQPLARTRALAVIDIGLRALEKGVFTTPVK